MHEWDVHLEICIVLKQKEFLGNICFSEQIFYRKQSLGAPDLGTSMKSGERALRYRTVLEMFSFRLLALARL